MGFDAGIAEQLEQPDAISDARSAGYADDESLAILHEVSVRSLFVPVFSIRWDKQGADGDLMQDRKRLIIGISGASGVTYGVRLLQLLRNAGIETHLVMSKTAEVTFAYETDVKIADIKALADVTHSIDDMAASISSGSFRTAGMIVAPCSMRSMSEIATGATTTLLTRAADVVL